MILRRALPGWWGGGIDRLPERAAVQGAHCGLRAIEHDVVSLDEHHHRAVLEVGGLDLGLQAGPEREALVAAYAAFLNGLSFPVQILVRAVPMDVELHAAALERRVAECRSEALALLARDHAVFLRQLARRRALLERRFYVVVPADAPRTGRTGPLRVRLWPFGRRRGEESGSAAATRAAARRQLAFRCDEVGRQLARCGLAARRLGTVELAALFYGCWCPELARVQRLRGALADRTVPVVRSAAPVVPSVPPVPLVPAGPLPVDPAHHAQHEERST